MCACGCACLLAACSGILSSVLDDSMTTLDWGTSGAAVYVAARVLTLLSRVQASVTEHLTDLRAIARADVDAREAMAKAVTLAAESVSRLARDALAPRARRAQGSSD